MYNKWVQLIVLAYVNLVPMCMGKRPLNNYIRHHEVLSYDTAEIHFRTKRALKLSPYANVNLKFGAFDRNFSCHLTRNHDIFAPGFKVVDQDGEKIEYDYSRFFHGDVEGLRHSHVIGLITEGRFQGSIHTHNDEYHIEPAERYYDDASERGFHSIMYSIHDLDMSNVNYATVPKLQRPTDLQHSESLSKQLQEEGKKRYKRGTKNRHRNTCNLKVVADHLFMRKFVRRETAIDEMVYHYQAVEYIFRNQTFNTTNQLDSSYSPEGIGFRIKEVHVLLKDTVPKAIKPTEMSVFRVLELFSQMNHSSVCLSYLFTDRSFDDGVLGLAYIAYPYGQPGGICDPYANYGGTMKSYNTGVLSFRLYNREAPRALTKIAFAHELGHSFGAHHDPPTKECQPGRQAESPDGNYIMYDKATQGHLKNNQAFSKCSIAKMIPVINAKGLEVSGGCFTGRFWAICGNGAHEEGEICDCGTVETCVERCCTPYGSPTGTPCTLQNEAYECSPSRGPCCLNDTCTIAREFLKCFDGTECQTSLECDGLHYTCPVRRFKANLTLCDKDRGVCINGYCQGSICSRYGYEGCQCNNKVDQCKVCCQYQGQCTSSFKIPGMPNKTMSRGKPCNYYQGYCDALAVCREIDMDGPMRMLYYTFFTEEGIKIWFRRYWFVVLLGSLLILCMLSAFVYYCARFTPSDNPILHQETVANNYYKPFVRKRNQARTAGYSTQPLTSQSYF